MKTKIDTRSMILCALFTALTAIGAFLRIPVPAVPFTLQYLMTMLAGLLLGGKLGSISVTTYIVMGLLGLPVFTEGGGLGYFLKPTFGYIIGFAIGAYITGKIAHKCANPTYRQLLAAALAGMTVVYVFGTVYFYIIINLVLTKGMDFSAILMSCVLLPLTHDIPFCFLGAYIAKRTLPIIRK